MRALCNVAKSTKEGKEGYIGEKGIGFKAVFMLTHYPQIVSGGFEFKLKHGDVSKPPHELVSELGFVVPYHEVDPQVARLREALLPPGGEVGTIIYLPFKEGEAATKLESLRNELEVQLVPELIIFLRRLQVINIRTPWGATLIELAGSPPNTGLRNNQTSRRWQMK